MLKLLENLYYGGEGYDELARQGESYLKAKRTFEQARDSFETRLDIEQIKQFEKCLLLHERAACEREEAAFSLGVRLGLELMWEVMRTR